MRLEIAGASNLGPSIYKQYRGGGGGQTHGTFFMNNKF